MLTQHDELMPIFMPDGRGPTRGDHVWSVSGTAESVALSCGRSDIRETTAHPDPSWWCRRRSVFFCLFFFLPDRV